jgi:RNA polymerase sigma-70 factor (ECF subfamily)
LQQGLKEQAADEILVRRFMASGDREAFELLVRRYSGQLRRLLCALFRGRREDMEDAEQEIFTELFLHLSSFRFQSSFRTYFYRLARNRAIDILRRSRSRRLRLQHLRERLGGRLASQPRPGPEEILVARDTGARVLAALYLLREEERMLIVMKDSENLTLREISAVLGVPQGTVKSRLHRAREKLVRSLREVEP